MEKEKKWYQKISNWLLIVACIILVPILIANLYIIIASKTNKDEIPSVFGYKPFMVLSGSMETEIYKGDLVITKIVDPKKLRINDVIAFRDAQNTITTHRIIDIVENEGITYFITKGDNNTTQDTNLVELEDVEGKYITRIPGIASVMNTLSKTSTLIVLIFGITAIFIIGFMISNKKERDLERLEFLEYKRQKELEEKAKKTTKTSSKPKTTTTKKVNTKTEDKQTIKKEAKTTSKSKTTKKSETTTPKKTTKTTRTTTKKKN